MLSATLFEIIFMNGDDFHLLCYCPVHYETYKYIFNYCNFLIIYTQYLKD